MLHRLVPLLALVLLREEGPDTKPAAPAFREEVVVTAERTAEPRADVPAAVSVLTREEIERTPAENLAELLDFVPGLQVLFAPAFGQTPMLLSRGFFGGGEAEYLQLLVDGVPVGDVESGLADWRRLRSSDIDHVEVVHGPASALYGDTALGGVVQVFTRGGSALGEGGQVSFSLARFRSLAADAHYRADVGERRLALAGSFNQTRGFRGHSAGEDASADVRLQGREAGRGLSLTLSGSLRDRDEPGPLSLVQSQGDPAASDALFDQDREQTQRLRGALTWSGGTGPGAFRAMLHGATREARTVRTLLVAAGLADRAFRRVSTDSVGLELGTGARFRLLGRDARLRLGLDAAREWLDTGYARVAEDGAVGPEIADDGVRRTRLAAFVSQDWRLSGRLRLMGAVRWDRIADRSARAGRSTTQAWSPRAGLNLRLGSESAPLTFFAQASRAFKAPTLDQLFDPRPFMVPGLPSFTLSNPSLTPQRASSREAGLSWRLGVLRADAAAYHMKVDDEIDFDPATFRYRNIGATLHRGIEGQVRLFDGRRFSPWVSYARTRAEPRVGPEAGHQLKNVPRRVLRAGLALRLPGGVQVDARQTWIEGRFFDDANRFPMSYARLMDLRLARNFGRARARIDLLNARDEAYEQVGLVLPDRAGRPVPYVFPGPGRAARVALDWTF